MRKTLTLAFAILFALTAAAQTEDTSVAAFEKAEAEFIAQELPAEGASDAISTLEHHDTVALIADQSAHYHGWVAKVVHWYGDNVGYGAVGALMMLESSFIPFPSEIVIPPAVMVAADPQTPNDMKIWLIVLIGTLGALAGAFLNYYLSRWLGRPIIYKFADSKLGHLLSLSREKVERAEHYFNDHGVVSTFVGRLIPVIRQLISIPAGLAKMNIGVFAFYTFLGAGIWNCILGLLGYLAVKAGGMDFIYKYSGLLSKIIIVIFVAAVAFLVVRSIIKKRRKGQNNAA